MGNQNPVVDALLVSIQNIGIHMYDKTVMCLTVNPLLYTGSFVTQC